MFMDEDGNDTESCQDRSGVMSLVEKMDMWHRESSREHAAFPEDALLKFEGVDDFDDDELISAPELSVYSKMIFKSSAYKWLVSTLKQHASISHGGGYATVAIAEIRQTVLRQLQTGTISKKRRPRTFEASFVLLGYKKTLKARLYSDVMSGKQHNLEDITVLVASSETNVQLSTVGQYMRQVWQDSGISLLRGLQDLVNENLKSGCVTGK